MIEWDYKLERDLHRCLSKAFTAKSMARLLRYELEGRRWDRLVPPNEGFDDQLFELISLAVREGWATDLAMKAHQENVSNRQLAAFVTRLDTLQPSTPQVQQHTLAKPTDTVLIPHIVTDPTLNIEWCWIPAGKFTMGEDKNAHQVSVDGFWMMRHPVTNAQYARFIADGGYQKSTGWTQAGWTERYQNNWQEPRYWQDTKWNGEQQPVVGITWYEAIAFSHWAARKIGSNVHLPAEAEWEKAARGTDARIYPWGDMEPDAKRCNYGEQIGKTTLIGNYSPMGDSPYGCTDMAGNVWEWCQSRDEGYPYDAKDGRNDLKGKGIRMVRGGSWYNYNNDVRAAIRVDLIPDVRYNDVGFRCASTPF